MRYLNISNLSTLTYCVVKHKLIGLDSLLVRDLEFEYTVFQ